jgi:hypothetical protein
MVFLVIAITVTLAGFTGGFIASLLGVRLAPATGWLIVGAGPLGLAIGRALRDAGQSVTFLDSSAAESHAAEEEDFPVIFGNALEESTLLRANLDRFAGGIAVTPNEDLNFLFAARARDDFRLARVWAAIRLRDGHVTPDMIQGISASLLFAGKCDPEAWSTTLRKSEATVETWEYRGRLPVSAGSDNLVSSRLQSSVLPLLHKKGRRVMPVSELTRIRKRHKVAFLVLESKRDDVVAWLVQNDWQPVKTKAKQAVEPVAEPNPGITAKSPG